MKVGMKMTNDEERRNAIDPAVTSALGRDPLYGRMAKERSMTSAQRKKLRSDRQRNRIMVDMPVELQEIMDRIAETESLPRSQVMCWLLTVGLKQFNRIEMIDAKVPSRSMRWEFTISLPESDLPDSYK